MSGKHLLQVWSWCGWFVVNFANFLKSHFYQNPLEDCSCPIYFVFWNWFSKKLLKRTFVCLCDTLHNRGYKIMQYFQTQLGNKATAIFICKTEWLQSITTYHMRNIEITSPCAENFFPLICFEARKYYVKSSRKQRIENQVTISGKFPKKFQVERPRVGQRSFLVWKWSYIALCKLCPI